MHLSPSRVAPGEMERARQRLLERIAQDLTSDDRVGAAWLAGSIGRGEADAWSDLDLHVFVHDEDLDGVLASRAAWYERWGPPILAQSDIPANAAQGGSFQLVIFPGGVELDLSVGPLRLAVRPAHTRLLFDRVGIPGLVARPLAEDAWLRRADDRLIFFWAMAPIAVKYAARGTTWKLVRMIDLLTDAYADLWNLLNGTPESLLSLNLTNAPLSPDLARLLPGLPPAITPAAALEVVRTMTDDVAGWHARFAERGVSVPSAMPETVSALIAVAAASATHWDTGTNTHEG